MTEEQMSSEREQIRQIWRRLREIGFDTNASRHPRWYTCVAVAMVWRPGTKKEIVEAAGGIVAKSLEWTVEPHPNHPCWHFGYKVVRGYFPLWTYPPVGKNAAFLPSCLTHHRSWRDAGATGDECTPRCVYEIEIKEHIVSPGGPAA